MRHAVAVGTTTEVVKTTLREHDRRDWQRHPVDVARLASRLTLLALVLVLTAAFPSALTNLSADLVRMFARMPDALRYGLVGIAQFAILLIPVIIVVWMLMRRTRQATALVVGAAVASGVVMVLLTDWLERAAPPTDVTDLPSSSFLPTDFPSTAYLATLVAGAAVASPMMTLYSGDAWPGLPSPSRPSFGCSPPRRRRSASPSPSCSAARDRFSGAGDLRVAAAPTGLRHTSSGPRRCRVRGRRARRRSDPAGRADLPRYGVGHHDRRRLP